MAKLTETFNDKAKSRTNGKIIGAVHEPLATGEFPKTMAAMTARANLMPPPAPFLVQGTNTSKKAPGAEKKPLKVALIGTAPSSRMLAPFNDPSWTIWACSPGNQNILPRADAWFELHGNLHWPENKHYGEPYVNWLRQLQIPVYMQNQDYVPHAIPFPMAQMVREFGQDFFTSSFAWMMAFAISQGAEEIALFGIDMASRDEYILQRPGFFYFRHVAQSRGIRVSAPNESDIMQSPGLYGYSEVLPFGRKVLAREVEIKQRIEPMKAERDKLNHNITYLEGALEDIDYIKSIQIGVTNDLALLKSENEELKAQVLGLTAKVNTDESKLTGGQDG